MSKRSRISSVFSEFLLFYTFFDVQIEEKRSDVNGRFEKVKSFTAERKKILEEAYNFYKLLSDIAMEEIWISYVILVLYFHSFTNISNTFKIACFKLKAFQSKHCNKKEKKKWALFRLKLP